MEDFSLIKFDPMLEYLGDPFYELQDTIEELSDELERNYKDLMTRSTEEALRLSRDNLERIWKERLRRKSERVGFWKNFLRKFIVVEEEKYIPSKEPVRYILYPYSINEYNGSLFALCCPVLSDGDVLSSRFSAGIHERTYSIFATKDNGFIESLNRCNLKVYQTTKRHMQEEAVKSSELALDQILEKYDDSRQEVKEG